MKHLLQFYPWTFAILIGLIELLIFAPLFFFIGRKYQKHREPVTIQKMDNRIKELEGYKDLAKSNGVMIKNALMALSPYRIQPEIEDSEE